MIVFSVTDGKGRANIFSSAWRSTAKEQRIFIVDRLGTSIFCVGVSFFNMFQGGFYEKSSGYYGQ